MQSEQREYEEYTNSEVKKSEEIKEDSIEARKDWSDQQEPSLSDTADELNQIAESLRSDIREQHGEQAEKVVDSIENQRREVSEPARAGENTERSAIDELNMASSRNKRFGKILAEASDRRLDAETFLREVAESDEDYQAREKETLDDHRRTVEEAIQGIRDL
jgi:hypothetical protein